MAIGQLVVKNLHLLCVVSVMFLRHTNLNVLGDALQLLNEQQHLWGRRGRSRNRGRRCGRCHRRHCSLRLNMHKSGRHVGRGRSVICRNRSSNTSRVCLGYEVARWSRLHLRLKAWLGGKRLLLWLRLLLRIHSLLLNLLRLLLLVHLRLRYLLLRLMLLLRLVTL